MSLEILTVPQPKNCADDNVIKGEVLSKKKWLNIFILFFGMFFFFNFGDF